MCGLHQISKKIHGGQDESLQASLKKFIFKGTLKEGCMNSWGKKSDWMVYGRIRGVATNFYFRLW